MRGCGAFILAGTVIQPVRAGSMTERLLEDPVDDGGLQRAPGSEAAMSALSSAGAEALESFAQVPLGQGCGRLERRPGLAEADRKIRQFYAQRTPAPGS